MNGKPWTKEDIETLRQRYPNESTKSLAEDLGRSVSAIYGAANIYGVSKTDEFIAANCRGLNPESGKLFRYMKGHTPQNKGVKGWDAGGRSHETRFKAGQPSLNEMPLGSFRLVKPEKHWYVKVAMHPRRNQDKWFALHKLIWIQHNGPIPPGHIIRFIDGDTGATPEDVVIENLECLSKAENMRRNTIHNLPRPMVDVIYQKGRLTREINKQSREANEK